jgi:mannose-1-phosphate guanylyltransferase/mannose-6-phosphate isomerase
MRIYPVILCGGSGSRLWPASRPVRPKQFIPLTSERSPFQESLARLEGLGGGQAPLVVAGVRHAAAVRAQLAEAGVEGVVMLEPEARDSAPAIAAAVAWIAARDPEAVVLVTPSDHHIPNGAAFRQAVERAANAASGGAVVTFGVRPTGPATAYGYLQPGPALAGQPGVHALTRFVEKPDAATAQRHLDAGFLWNSGYFVFGAAGFLAELERHAPAVAAAAAAAVSEADERAGSVRLGQSFRTAPKISIDYAVMEKTDRAAVIPVDFAWSDLGAWDSIWAASPRDSDGVSARGDVLLVDSRDCLVRNASGRLVVGVGLRGLAVVAEPDAVLVCDLASSQTVKAAVDRLQAEGRAEAQGPAASAGLGAVRSELVRWLLSTALPVWWALGADHAGGGFFDALDQEARPVRTQRRARVQTRQVFAFAVGATLGWTGPWRQAVEHGLDYFLDRFRRPDGLFRTLVGEDGAPVDETAMLYDQAFALFAFAWAARVLPGRAEVLADEAAQVLARLRETRWDGRGFAEAAGPTPYQANPQMHLFEAALAWAELGRGDGWERLADDLAGLALDRFIDPRTGALREFFAADWSPAPGAPGRLVEPGHQFEWAWLLERWGRRRGRDDARTAARRLYEVGLLGVDQRRGVAMNALLDDLTLNDPGARLWPQTERLKAALILAESGGDAPAAEGYREDAVAAARGLQLYLDGVVPGLWRDKLRPDGGFVAEPAPASSLYHIACAIADLDARAPADRAEEGETKTR